MEIFIITLLTIILALILAKIIGELFEKMGQSAVLGELMVGIVMGPSLLHILQPGENEVFTFLAEIGVILLLFEVGLESNVYKLLKSGMTATLVACVGVAVPLITGYAYFALSGHPSTVALFIGATLTATSVGITMRVLSDIKRIDTEEGRIILGAAVIDDVIGLIILSIVTGIVELGKVSIFGIGKITFVSVLFLVLTTWVGIKFTPWLFRYINRMQVRGSVIVFAFALSLILAVMANLIGLATIVGAFAAGLILERTEQKEHIHERIQPVADMFVPLFFIQAGAYIDVHVLANLSNLGFIIVLTLIAIAGKLASGIAVIGKKANPWAIGIGMIPRGEVGLIFATFGLTSGLIDASLYGVLVIMIMLTTFITPPLLKPIMLKLKVKGSKD
ncbi:MAG: Na+/H+-exchanging protein [archaeon GW2011_AR3]|nr:MAG: Na+/H+-exchanging protein [archaeon GW2011_AR3]MBS3109729.1 cation:proton antiporter [Candidatus Woesearchaeota archaeon]